MATLDFFHIRYKDFLDTLGVERDSINNAFPAVYENEAYEKTLAHINDAIQTPGRKAIWGSKNDDYLFLTFIGGDSCPGSS